MMKQKVREGIFPRGASLQEGTEKRANGVFVNMKEVEGRNIGRSQVVKVWLRHVNSILKAFGSP